MAPSNLARSSSDEPNAFAPPMSDVEPAKDSVDIKGKPLALRPILSRTWRIFSERPEDCVGLFLACAPLTIVAGQALVVFALPPEARKPPEFGPAAALLAELMFVLFHAWVSLGLVIVLIDIARGREFDFGNVFGGARFIVRAIPAVVVFAMAVAPAILIQILAPMIILALVQVALEYGPIVPVLGGIAGFVVVLGGALVTLVVGLRLSLFVLLIVDRDVGVFDSLRLSFLITRGHVWRMFLLALLALAINFAGLALFGIGSLFTVPFTALLFVVTYDALISQPAAGPVSKGKPIVDPEMSLL